jgi:hypothetical protein
MIKFSKLFHDDSSYNEHFPLILFFDNDDNDGDDADDADADD